MYKKGFTLIEIIMSVLLISIIAGGMFGAFVGARAVFNMARHRTQAYNFAREAVDRLRSDYSYGGSEMGVGDGHLESEIGSIIEGDLANFSGGLTYDVTEEPTGGYKQVVVHVSWEEASVP